MIGRRKLILGGGAAVGAVAIPPLVAPYIRRMPRYRVHGQVTSADYRRRQEHLLDFLRDHRSMARYTTRYRPWPEEWERFTRAMSWEAQAAFMSDRSEPVGGYGDVTLNPYSRYSPWKTPIGSGATWDTTSAGAVQLRGMVAAGVVVQVHTGSQYCQPWYASRSTDPLFTLTDASNAGHAVHCATGQLHIPLGAKASGGTQHMSVMCLATGTVWHGYLTVANGSSSPGYTNPDGSATTAIDATTTSVTYNQGAWRFLYGNAYDPYSNSVAVSRYGWGDCVVRAPDIASGKIEHVLRVAFSQGLVAVPYPGSDYYANAPFPTVHCDYCADPANTSAVCTSHYVGNIPAGVLMGIPRTVNINSLRINGTTVPDTYGMMLLRAAQNFGAIYRDTTGKAGSNEQMVVKCSPGLGISGDPDYNAAAIAGFNAVMPVLSQNLALCTNYAPGLFTAAGQPAWPYAGGGNPIASPPAATGPWDFF